MRRGRGVALLATMGLVLAFVVAAQGSTSEHVQVSVLTAFAPGGGPTDAAATNTGDVIALAGTHIVEVGPTGKQNPLAVTVSGGEFGGPLGAVYDNHHQLYVALLGSFFGPPPPAPIPGIYKISANGKTATP